MKMKRPPGIWMLLSAGVLWLSLQDVYGIRGTALIFAKSTTTTPGPVANVTDGAEVVTESSTDLINATKSNLTGNPQLDYIYDPNLPKELNGYNLSEYPFYERVPDPDEIDFKCDGLHDGFYASIPFKCQVYHHCLFGTRYDFLCANYTAFDQKTFICQFVSDVDCVGSKKFWHRNDALYQAASTTTVKPVLNIYTPPPEPNPVLSGGRGGGLRGGGKGRRPLQRRPQYDYYDYADYDEEYYEERPRSRRKRPRPRPRPAYEDEYEEDFEEEAYDRRNRRPYNRRGGSDRRRNKNRNKNREDIPEDEVERPKDRKKISDEDDEDLRSSEKRKPARDDQFEDETPNEKRKPAREDTQGEKSNDRRKPQRVDKFEDERPNEKRKSQRGDQYDDERSSEKKKPSRDDKFEDDRPSENRKPIRGDDLEDDYDIRPSRPRKGSRRPSVEDEYDDEPRNEDRRKNRPRKKIADDFDVKPEETQPIIKPTTGTIYDRPRVAPRIKPPVPKNEASKYAYKPIAKATTASSLYDEEYYDEYEEDLEPKFSKGRKPETESIRPKASETKERKQASASSRSRTKTTLDEEDDALTLPQKNKAKPNRGKDRYRGRSPPKTTAEPFLEENDPPKRTTSTKRPKYSSAESNSRERITTKKPLDPEYYDDEYEIEKTSDEPRISSTEAPKKKWKPSTEATTSTTTTTHRTTRLTTTTVKSTVTPSSEGNREQIVRIVKRPFLPSRGGTPYSPRGLQPVGFKAPKPEVMEQQGSVDVHQKSKDLYTNEPSTYKPQLQDTQTENSKPNRQSYNEEHVQPSSNKATLKQKYTDDPQEEIVNKPYLKTKFSEPISDDDDDFKPVKRPQHILRPNNHDGNDFSGPRTTQKPKVPERNPLDIIEDEYDVTLNDALNPTLPNLPVRSNYPSAFSPANDYTFSAFQRPRYVLDPQISSANTEYVYQPKQAPARQRFEVVPQSYNQRDQFIAPSNDYNHFYTPVVNSNSKRGITQARSQPYYSTSY